MSFQRRRDYLLPLACALAAILLAASEFMTLFQIDVEGTIVEKVKGGDEHSYALLVVAVFALVALTAATLYGTRPAALAVAVAGAIALLIVLVGDLPDVNRKGTLPNFFTSRAEPAAGFWFELAGATLLAICGGTLATGRQETLDRRTVQREAAKSETG